MELDTVPMLIEGVEMPLKIAVPVEHCDSCNFEWTDHRAEDIRIKLSAIYYPENVNG